MPEALALDWDQISAAEVFPGITRQVHDLTHCTVIRYVYQPGARFPTHQHPEEQVTIVLSGAIAFEVGGREVIARVGSTLVIPANLPHGAAVVGDDVVESINVLAPARMRPIEVLER